MSHTLNVENFIYALQKNDLVKVAYYIERGGDVNEYYSGWTPLMHFVAHDNAGYEAFEFLLETGKDIGLDVNKTANFANRWSVLLLTSVTDARNTCLELLLKYAKETGLDVNYRGYVRHTDTDDNDGGKTGLMLAIKYGALDNIRTYIKYMEPLGIKITKKEIEYTLSSNLISYPTRQREIMEVCEEIKWTK